MSRQATIQLDVDISKGVANLNEIGEQLGDMTDVEITAEADTDEAQQATENLSEEVEKSTESAKKNASAFDTVKKATVAIEGPMGGVSSRLSALNAIWQAFIGFIRASTASLKAFRIALIATGVGAFVVVLGTALNLLRGLQTVMDRIERVTTAVGTAFDFARTRLGAFLGLNDDVNRSLRETLDLNDELIRQRQELRRLEVDAIVPIERHERAIREMREALRDESIATEERMEILDDLRRKEEELAESRLFIAQQNFDILKEQATLAENTLEDDRELAEAEAELDRLRGEAANRRRALFREERRLRSEMEREEQERREAERQRIIERLEEQGQMRQSMIEMRQEMDSWHDAQDELNRALEETQELIGEDLEFEPGPMIGSIEFVEQQIRDVNERINKATSDSERERLAIMRQSYQQQLEEYRSVMEGQEEADKQFTGASIEGEVARAENAQEGAKGVIKSIAAEAAANAARSVFATTPFPFSVPLAGAAAGAAQLAVNNLASFAKGGSFETSGPQLIQVGDNPGGRERVDVTPLSSPNIDGPQQSGNDFRRALSDVDWDVDFALDGDTIKGSLRKSLRSEKDLGGSGEI